MLFSVQWKSMGSTGTHWLIVRTKNTGIFFKKLYSFGNTWGRVNFIFARNMPFIHVRKPCVFYFSFSCLFFNVMKKGHFRGLDPIKGWCFSHAFVNAFCESSRLSHKRSGVLQSHIAISPSGPQRASTSLKMHQRGTKDLPGIWANGGSKPYPHSANNPGRELCSGLKNNNDTFGKIWQAQQLFPCPKNVMCRNAVEAADL